VSQPPTSAPNELPIDQLVAAPLSDRSIGGADSNFIIAEWTMRGELPGHRRLVAPLHVHHGDDESWYVLEGTLAFQLGDREIEAAAGTSVFVPRGLAHTWWNPRTESVRYLLITTPNICQLIADLHALADDSIEAQQAVFRRHNSDLS
jgi:mannose-6-phosphate isomerase-like protein (cupin superfamily)